MQQTPRNLRISLLIAFIIVTGLMGSMFFPPFMVWGVITIMMLGAILIGHPRHVLFLFWLWASFRPLILGMNNNPVVKGSNAFFYAAVVGICFAGYARRRTDIGRIAVVCKIGTALLGVMLLSFLVNRSPVFNVTWFFMNYLAYPFIFYVAYTTLDRRHWRYLVGGLIGLMLIQFALNIGWRLGINPLPNIWKGTGNTYDLAQGTFATSAHVAYLMAAVIFFLFSALRLGAKYRRQIIFLLGVAVIQFYITYTNHAYLIFIVLLPIYFVVSKQPVRVRAVWFALVVLGGITFSSLTALDFKTEGMTASVDASLTSENLQTRWDRFAHGPKIELINRITIQNATRDPLLWMLGNGPGTGLSAVALEHGRAFAWQYLGEYISNTAEFEKSEMNSVTGSFYSGVLSVWSDIGAIGYLLNLSLYLYAIGRVGRQIIRDQYRDALQLVLAEGFVMAMLIFLIASFVMDVFWVPYFTVGLWIWAAMVWDPVAPEEEKAGGQQSEAGSQKSAVRGWSVEGRPPSPVVNGWKRPVAPGR